MTAISNGGPNTKLLLNRIDRIVSTTSQHWGIGNGGRAVMDRQRACETRPRKAAASCRASIAAQVAAFRRDGMD